jgi:glycosyltransferase involved in cell wall biosynthesis
MRILLTTVSVPFVRGGAEFLAEGIRDALRRAGHEADIMTLPFYREPVEELYRYMDYWERFPFDSLWFKADRVIPLKFPTYFAQAPGDTTWLLHEFREAYDLLDSCYAPADDAKRLRDFVREKDRVHLGRVKKLYTLSQTVTKRVKRWTGVDSEPLYHPCPEAERFRRGSFDAYIYAPSRLEPLKRQNLLIEAMRYVRSPVKAVISGEGTLRDHYRQLVDSLGIADRVLLPGYVLGEARFSLYADCLAVFFAPFDEDYGYITLEGMLSGKPIITANDSGGPCEFVKDGETGFILPPEPKAIAEVIDRLYNQRTLALSMGEAGRIHYRSLDINWDNVVDSLVC